MWGIKLLEGISIGVAFSEGTAVYSALTLLPFVLVFFLISHILWILTLESLLRETFPGISD